MNSTEQYIRDIDNVLRREFPTYWAKIKNSSQYKRKKTWIISQEEITELHQNYKKSKDIQARNLLIYSQLKLVYFFAKDFAYKHSGSTLDGDDLLGFANEILVELIDEYDPYKDKGEADIKSGNVNKFPSFIQTWLVLHLHTKMKDYGSVIKQAHNQISDNAQVRHFISLFNNQNGRQPYDGETTILTINGLKKRVTFDQDNIEIEALQANQWIKEKKVRRRLEMSVVSGNNIANEFGDEYFDLLESDNNREISVENLAQKELASVMQDLSFRDKEIISLRYIAVEQLSNIPYLLTPNQDSLDETRSMNKTSSNTIDIYIETNDSIFFIQYMVTANHHIEPNNIDKVNLTAVNDCFTIGTNAKGDTYNIAIANAKDIEVYHKTCKSKKQLPYKYDGQRISFDVLYSYGQIFTAQTSLNNERKIMSRLRNKMKNFKPDFINQ